MALGNEALLTLSRPSPERLDRVPQHVLAPPWEEPNVKGAKRTVFVEPIAGASIVVLVTVRFCNVVPLAADIDYGTTSMNKDCRPHVFVVAIPALVVVRIDGVECFRADAIEGKED